MEVLRFKARPPTLPFMTSVVQHLSEKGVCTWAPNPREPGIYLSFPLNAY